MFDLKLQPVNIRADEAVNISRGSNVTPDYATNPALTTKLLV